ncbi:MAG: competence/damage-inducible protein A [Bacteroidetes bacterium]|nr:competence/damage-inducible protein A [Bacteroidota bacterium]
MTAEIISIGDELLIGQVINTNASWIAGELNKAGILVSQVTAIGDNSDDIQRVLKDACLRNNIVLLTGGLGPTKDDTTKSVLAEYFNSGMIFHEPTFQHIRQLFKSRNYEVTPVNRQQAEIPEKCTPLPNENGTAPGMWFEENGKVIISMPGVPFEMQPMLLNQVIPKLQKNFELPFIYHKTIMTQGLGESKLAERIQKIEDNLPKHIKLAYLPQPGIVRLRLSANGKNKTALEDEINFYCRKLLADIPELIFGYDDILLEAVVGNLLTERKENLSTAESCTGGYLAHLITSIPGSSNYYFGSVISYSNEVKIGELNVSSADLEKYGAVSQQVVEQMAKGAREKFKTNYSLATSGVAGPDGGTKEKPVGTIWIALASEKGVQSKLLHMGEHRGRNIRRTALEALNMLRLEISEHKKTC